MLHVAVHGTYHEGVCVLMSSHAFVMRSLTSHSNKTGTEHTGLSRDEARNQSLSAEPGDVFGESHELHLAKIVRPEVY